MLLIVGLGNIGNNYDNTYHNIGFMCLDSFLKTQNLSLTKKKNDGFFLETKLFNEKVIFVKPTTFMNDSGICIDKFMRAYKLKPSDVLVICDDFDMEIGKVRFRNKGSAGTHNGLRSVVYELDSEEFKRLRIGIHDNENNIPILNFVLSKIGKNLEKYDEVFKKTNLFLETYIKNKGQVDNTSL